MSIPEQQLAAILAGSRKRNADVTVELSGQVFEALEALLAGFAAADERDGTGALRAAIERGDDHLYAGLLTVLLRVVFLLYCEDHGLLPTELPLFAESYSVLGLESALQADHGRYPDTMHRRFGAYPRLVGLFRAVFLGVSHGDLTLPARRGELFDPDVYPFLEGRGPEGSAPVTQPEARAAVKPPSVDDFTIHTVLRKLLYLDGQRLSYKALEVEQIGSVYEALMGFAVKRVESGAVRIKLGSKKGAARVWVEAEALLGVAANQRERWLADELGFDKNVAGKIAEAVSRAKDADEALLAMEPSSGRHPERAKAGTLVIQPGPERRRTSSHYTPRTLTEPIVARALEPLIDAMGEAASSEALLRLVVCDPAVGSGAFLVAACRYLADRVVEAWSREGEIHEVASAHEDVVNRARRLVAQRCLYGVDKNTYAVQLARLSLWLVTMARNEPFTFVDHAIRHGDSLVGLSFDQIRAFDWKPEAQLEPPGRLLKEALDEAVEIRKKILDLASKGTYPAQREKERLLGDAEDALERARLVGDLVVGAFFAGKNEKEREAERKRRLDRVEHWIAAEKGNDRGAAERMLVELEAMQAELRREQAPFHWMIEFPEVFYVERPDPLDGERVNGAAFVDAFVGNPPFLGGIQISGRFGGGYADWLRAVHDQAAGNADLSAHFFLRSNALLGENGTIGLIATNTIAQGDTRDSSLKPLLAAGLQIYAASRSLAWPGEAMVAVSVVHLAKGSTRGAVRERRLDDRSVANISSRLRGQPERPDPVTLASNRGKCLFGVTIHGSGFLVDPEEYAQLVEEDRRNETVLRPYVGGEQINREPSQNPERYVIFFGDRGLAQAREWPSLLKIVEERVLPERSLLREDSAAGRLRKENWWRFAGAATELHRALERLRRCIVISQVSKHSCFTFQPVGRVFSKELAVIPSPAASTLASLQSRIHEHWSRLLSSSMRTDLRYSASDCFETFPFPEPDPRAVIPGLEALGEDLFENRARFMIDTDQGLTRTYNALKNPDDDDPRVLELRSLHEEMDRAVLAAYGWSDIAVPPYCPVTGEEKAALQAFEDEVIDRLFVLNAERAEQEKQASAAAAPARPARNAAPRRTAAPAKKIRSPRVRTTPTLPGFEDDDGP